jgi:TRAP-type uncharacterized transport system substrate-binding protein
MSRARVLLWFGCLAFGSFTPMVTALAQPADTNQNTVTILSGEPAWMQRALDLSFDLTHENGLRILPMQEKGCIDATAALLQRSQVDVALLTTDCVAYAQQQGLVPQAERVLAYVAKREALPIFLVTSRGNKTLTSLAGKRIATGPAYSAGFASGEILLGALGLPFLRVAKSGSDGLAVLKQGEADAVLLLGLDALDGTLDPAKFHVLGIVAPPLENSPYAPALVEASALEGLSDSPAATETVSTSLVLATINEKSSSPRKTRLELFAATYFATKSTSADAMHLSAIVAGWQRLAASEQALEKLADKNLTINPTPEQGDGP